jgi:hypothetical protein
MTCLVLPRQTGADGGNWRRVGGWGSPSRAPSGVNASGRCWGRLGVPAPGHPPGHSRAIPWPFPGHSRAIPWPFPGHSLAIPWPSPWPSPGLSPPPSKRHHASRRPSRFAHAHGFGSARNAGGQVTLPQQSVAKICLPVDRHRGEKGARRGCPPWIGAGFAGIYPPHRPRSDV